MPTPIRELPPLNALLERRAVKGLLRRLRREIVVRLAREALEGERAYLREGGDPAPRYGTASPRRPELLRAVERRLLEAAEALDRPKQLSVVNATGVLLHTNLGRARLSAEAIAELERVAARPCALEVELSSGRRGSRNERVIRWLTLLTGAEDALVVNNGAAALWLAVHALAPRRRAVISRGEQVAIGGSFRMPELLRTTGAVITEVGTTNKTGLADYRKALRERDVVVKVHPSNYRIEGFTQEVDLPDLAGLCHQAGARLIFDAGSGSLYNFGKLGLVGEAPVGEALAAGCDLVTFSGDKLLGGPQAGLVLGRRELVQKMATHPVMRALRCDKLILAALEATLVAYAARGSRPDLPLFEALTLPVGTLRKRARAMMETLRRNLPEGWEVRAGRSTAAVGGGSFAEHPYPSWELTVRGPRERDAQWLHAGLREGSRPILTRVGAQGVRIDMRSPLADEFEYISRRIAEIVRSAPRPSGTR